MNTTYAIRVEGHLDDHWCSWLVGLTITHNGDGTSTVTGAVADQAQLHGLLAALGDIGATLLELCVIDSTGASVPPHRRAVTDG